MSGAGKKAGKKTGKKDGKKAPDPHAIERQQQRERDQMVMDEENARLEIELSQQVMRKECKMTKRKAIHKLLTDQDREIASLNAQMKESRKESGTQMTKLEDELARLAMSKEIVAQQLAAAQAELGKLKGDDGSKATIRNLTAQVASLEDELRLKAREAEDSIEALNQKLAKQITENRLMRIQAIDNEQEWERRVRKLEADVREALRDLTAQRMAGDVRAVEEFLRTVEKSQDEYLQALKQAQEQLIGFADCLVDMKSMHSNLPIRIRNQLQELPKEELLLIIDSLSFEEGVLQHLNTQFPRT
eukprot:EG_transcript_13402